MTVYPERVYKRRRRLDHVDDVHRRDQAMPTELDHAIGGVAGIRQLLSQQRLAVCRRA